MCFLCVITYFIHRIEVKQRNFEDLMYDLQSLQEKNGRLKDRVREVAKSQITKCMAGHLNLMFFQTVSSTLSGVSIISLQVAAGGRTGGCDN